jgi:hypothetical protein
VTVGNNTWGSGGGYSTVFSKPSYQTLVNTGTNPGRAVPDVSLMMGGCLLSSRPTLYEPSLAGTAFY